MFSQPASSLIIFVILAKGAAILQCVVILISPSSFWTLKKGFVLPVEAEPDII